MKLGIGTVHFGMSYGLNSTNKQLTLREINKILNYARTIKINTIDTAPIYGNSEEKLGKYNISDFDIITKTKHFLNKKLDENDVKILDHTFKNSLTLLKKNSIYSLMIHNADDLKKKGSDKIFFHLQKLKLENKIKKIGVSVYDSKQLEYILNNFDIDLVQLPLSILDRRLIYSGMLDKLIRKKIEVHSRSIFLQGLLLSNERLPKEFYKWKKLWKIWYHWLNDNKITALEATVRFAISTKEISRVLVGIQTKKQLEEIVLASDGILPEIPSELYTDDTNLLNPSNWLNL